MDEQIEHYARYACSQPQICPDVGGIEAQELEVAFDPQASPTVVSFLLTNCSAGDTDLRLDGVTIDGDQRCAFSRAQLAATVLAPGETTAIATQYRPPAAGEDHAELVVKSNAQNFPALRLRLCALAQAPLADAGPAECDAGPGVPLECKPQNTPSTCSY